MSRLVFCYDDQILTRYPTLRGGVILAADLANGPSPAELVDDYTSEQQRVVERIGDAPLSEIPSLSAWRRAFSAFGAKPTQYRSAAEALLRRLTKKGDIPSINLLVDIGNLVSIRYALPVAVFDQATVTGATTVRFADGTERFTDLGSSEVVHPSHGEVVFVDDDGLVSARRWCWRQSAQSAAGPHTTRALVTVEAHHEGGEGDVRAALEDLLVLLRAHQPHAETRGMLLSPQQPAFE